jgi:DNA-binding CsgD family transcriptional regulator
MGTQLDGCRGSARPPAWTGQSALLHGRSTEQAVIGRLIAAARAGRSGALVIRGEPGIGKTALLEYAAAVAAGMGPELPAIRLIRGAGAEAEAELPYSGLHMLLGTALNRLPALPRRQQDALRGGFGLGPAVAADRFLVGLAVLSLLTEVAEDGPLLCLVDDAHWLDRASADALVFAARRLHAEGIAIILAARSDEAQFPAPGLSDVRLTGLDASSAAELVMEHGGAALPPEIRRKILAEASGNPLGLIELPAAYLTASSAATRLGGLSVPLTDRLQRTFCSQVRRFPAATQTVLLAAAAESSGDLAVVLAAVGALGAGAADLEPAERAGLIHITDGTIQFRHPLVRSAMYQGAVLSQRVAAHRALAGALLGQANADRRAWHLAAAATRPDESVAAELQRTAAKAAERGGYAAAAAAYERAVQLTVDPAAQAIRLTLAAEAAAEIGDFDRARVLAARAADYPADPVIQARLVGIRARADFGKGRVRAAYELQVDGAAQIAGRDPLRATRMMMYAVHIAWFLGDHELMSDTADRLESLRRSVPEPVTPLVRLLLCSAAQATKRPHGDVRLLRQLVAQARSAQADDSFSLMLVAAVSLVTGLNWDARDILANLAADARMQGKIGALPTTLTCLAQALVFDGRLSDGLTTASEAVRIAQDTSQPQWSGEANAICAYLAAIHGDEERCRRLVDAVQAETASRFAIAATPWVPWALGMLELGHGRLNDALRHLETIARGPAWYHASALRSIPDLVEAAVRIGEPQRACAPLARFSAWAKHSGAPGTNALAERCHALLAAEDDAERHYLAALNLHEPSFEQARTQLLYGAWLRRARRKAEARSLLRAAEDYLVRSGAGLWASRARAELAATGVGQRGPRRPGPPRLTPQELQIALLAAQGLSNRDIAAQLFLSHRTVGYHLYKAYPKLGITSRAELDPDLLGP